MYEILTDIHTHTLFSVHATSTLLENVHVAAERGLEAIGITDHFSDMFWPVTKFENYGNFCNRDAFPKEWEGVKVYTGAEVDIISKQGHLFGYDRNLGDTYFHKPEMSWLEMVDAQTNYLIASVHPQEFLENATVLEVTDMYCKVLQNPSVLVLGHIGRTKHSFDLDTVLLTAKESGKLVELNNSYLHRGDYKDTFAPKLLCRAAELGVKISVSTDAHCACYVGDFTDAKALLEKVHFPEELIANRNAQTLAKEVKKITDQKQQTALSW